MYKFANDLPVLVPIIIEVEEEETNNREVLDIDIADFKESIQYFIYDYINNNIRKFKYKSFEDDLYDVIYTTILNTYSNLIYDIPDLDYHIYDAIEIYFYRTNSFRSYSTNPILKDPNIRRVKKVLKYADSVDQPEQRTKEWFDFRWNGLSASNLYCALDSDAKKNQLIYSKCKPIDYKKKMGTNIFSACHNGHKFEPLSIMIYEKRYNTKVGEFGCIKHRNLDILRASPDGINIDENSKLFGRMVEVKNPVSRELDGKPKKEYWVQMQIQMEVWDLQECDFLETVFKSYKNEEEFLEDGDTFTRTKDGKMKGIIIQFYDNNEPVYEYPEIDLSKEEFDKWYDNIMEKNSNMTWIGNVHWYMHDYSCVLVPRNKIWFKTIEPDIKEIWKIILKERKTGYDHRKPKKRKKKLSPKSFEIFKTETDKLFKNEKITPEIDNKSQNIVIKVRTESFDKN